MRAAFWLALYALVPSRPPGPLYRASLPPPPSPPPPPILPPPPSVPPQVDKDKNGTLDQTEFIALIRKRCERPLRSFADQFTDEKLRETFEMYDDDGNNEMDADELVVAWKKVTDRKISPAEAQALIGQGSANGNATLDKDEFVQLVRAHA